MPLVNMTSMLAHADYHGYGVGAFNTLSIEAVRGAIRAAEELRSPIILQLAQVQLDIAPLNYMAPVMLQAAQNATVPVVVHFDHGEDMDHIKQALDLGFSSVMYDGASYPMLENMHLSKIAVDLAHTYDATCEAELGRVGGSEDGSKDLAMLLTDVQEVKTFIAGTGVDALAIAIGNAHGAYKESPNIQFQRLREINRMTEVPLVLHGGSGISEEDFRKSVKGGIQKINVATALQQDIVAEVHKLCHGSFKKPSYSKMYTVIEEAVFRAVKRHITLFMSDGKAGVNEDKIAYCDVKSNG
ncbi:ketose-bisphosphate aldolase [Vallitalea pronyensis]|uniref:Ketose-bisphosphate aldolase n=1 Tax=Vallitalea pronyensis TaxID=1348613 RepID=A0A8J8SEW6_9FIRM|nr:ketose-bisphosphate aldolase [Vallitalea pronyensis]QUI21026.1 ketose-bisphosphate aldolase [Vallitalea pronyensis]